MSKHINYLTQVSTGKYWTNLQLLIQTLYLQFVNIFSPFIGQPHEGSAYGSLKMYKTARHRLEHTRARLQDLENLKNRALASTVRPTSAQNNP